MFCLYVIIVKDRMSWVQMFSLKLILFMPTKNPNTLDAYSSERVAFWVKI